MTSIDSDWIKVIGMMRHLIAARNVKLWCEWHTWTTLCSLQLQGGSVDRYLYFSGFIFVLEIHLR